MNQYQIYHNPQCSKSRAALSWLNERGITPQVIEYLNEPLSAPVIRDLLMKLGLKARDILRDSEAEYATLRLGDSQKKESEIIAAIVAHPILLQRPIVVRDHRAVVARPTEKLTELLSVRVTPKPC